MRKFLGYTLIELLIVISLVSILTTLGVSSYRKGQAKQQSEAAIQSIISLLHQNQAASIIGKKDCAGTYIGQRITVTSSTDTLTSQSVCADNDLGVAVSTQIPGIVFNQSVTFTFKPLSQGLDLEGASSLNLDFHNASNTLYRIELTSAGTIKSQGEI